MRREASGEERTCTRTERFDVEARVDMIIAGKSVVFHAPCRRSWCLGRLAAQVKVRKEKPPDTAALQPYIELVDAGDEAALRRHLRRHHAYRRAPQDAAERVAAYRHLGLRDPHVVHVEPWDAERWFTAPSESLMVGPSQDYRVRVVATSRDGDLLELEERLSWDCWGSVARTWRGWSFVRRWAMAPLERADR
jgi:hypothetical protein